MLLEKILRSEHHRCRAKLAGCCYLSLVVPTGNTGNTDKTNAAKEYDKERNPQVGTDHISALSANIQTRAFLKLPTFTYAVSTDDANAPENRYIDN